MVKKILFSGLLAALFFSACKKETEELKTAAISEYVPLQVGKYITYQLDSFRYLPFSTQGITITYQVKFLVDAEITDNLGRPAYRIVRHIRLTEAEPWVPDNTFSAVNTGTGFEFIDNNLRFLKLKEPVKNGYTWKGNSFINTSSQYSDFRFLDGWDYAYDSLDAPLTLGAINLDSTVKIAQRDEIIGNPDDPGSYSEQNYGVEYYAKGIGLVYKRFFHSEYQPPTSGGSGYYSDASKGFTLTMIDHN
ncbi:MAG: hypothetical protein IPP72_11350 [Chitinophagaceae bacterium]|nr:hypothetical protein [Chitinophagaceae bacterium]